MCIGMLGVEAAALAESAPVPPILHAALAESAPGSFYEDGLPYRVIDRGRAEP